MNHQNIDEIVRDERLLLNAVREGAREAVIMHKRLGNPIAGWRDGKSVLIQPEDIEIPPPVEPVKTDTNAA